MKRVVQYPLLLIAVLISSVASAQLMDRPMMVLSSSPTTGYSEMFIPADQLNTHIAIQKGGIDFSQDYTLVQTDMSSNTLLLSNNGSMKNEYSIMIYDRSSGNLIYNSSLQKDNMVIETTTLLPNEYIFLVMEDDLPVQSFDVIKKAGNSY